MDYAVLVDFGSTYTKMVCVDLVRKAALTTDQFPSTVHTDATKGLSACFEAARACIGRTHFSRALKMATSSAAGGLRMAVVGLTRSLSNEAGRNTSFSAGAKIVCSFSGYLQDSDVETINQSKAEILLLCGGYEGGNTDGLLHNAEVLGHSKLSIPVIYAGNSAVSREVRRLFAGKECFLTENVIPAVGTLNTASAAAIIRDLFMKRIIDMKGVGIVQGELDAPIIPTPAAVLAAGRLLAAGTDREAGLGPLMIADIGGATTDIYSYIENTGYEGAKCIGSVESFSKRTVEGDMGMRESSGSLAAEAGEKELALRCGITKETLTEALRKRMNCTEYVADNPVEKSIDHMIACSAIHISARRHAGHISREFSNGSRFVQRGKNLTDIKTMIGTGGIIVHDSGPAEILKSACIKQSEKGEVLLPNHFEPVIDQNYVLFAAGLLSSYSEDAALSVMKHSLTAIG